MTKRFGQSDEPLTIQTKPQPKLFPHAMAVDLAYRSPTGEEYHIRADGWMEAILILILVGAVVLGLYLHGRPAPAGPSGLLALLGPD